MHVNTKMPKTALKLEDFEVLQTIGTGTFGVCRKVRRKNDGKVGYHGIKKLTSSLEKP